MLKRPPLRNAKGNVNTKVAKEVDEDEEETTKVSVKKPASKKITKPVPEPDEDEDDMDEVDNEDMDEDEVDDEIEDEDDEEEEVALPKKKIVKPTPPKASPKKKPAPVVEEPDEDDMDDEIEDDDDEVAPPKKKVAGKGNPVPKNVKKETPKKAPVAKKEEEPKLPKKVLDGPLRTEFEFEENTFVTKDQIVEVMQENLKLILARFLSVNKDTNEYTVSKVMTDEIITALEDIYKEAFKKQAPITFVGRRFNLRKIKGRFFNNPSLKGNPTFVTPHYELKYPPITGEDYKEECRIPAKYSKKDPNHTKPFVTLQDGKNMYLTSENIANLDEEFFPEEVVATPVKKTASKSTTPKKSGR